MSLKTFLFHQTLEKLKELKEFLTVFFFFFRFCFFSLLLLFLVYWSLLLFGHSTEWLDPQKKPCRVGETQFKRFN